MSNVIRFNTPAGDSIALTGSESITLVQGKGVMITLPQFEKPRGWIPETNVKRAKHIRDCLIAILENPTQGNERIDWDDEFKSLETPKKAS